MGVIKLQAKCCDFIKKSRSMILIILLTLIIAVENKVLKHHFNLMYAIRNDLDEL